jgi:hypothetical protein
MRIALRVLPVILLVAIALMANVSTTSAAKLEMGNTIFSPNPTQAGDNVTAAGGGEDVTGSGGTSFWSIFPSWVWWAIGGIVGILVIMIIVLVAVPSRKKQGAAAIKGAQGIPGMQGPQGPEGPMPIPTPMSGPGSPGSFNPPVGTTMPPQAPGAFPMQEQFPTPGAFPAPAQYPSLEPGPMAAPYPQYARRPIFSVSNLTITPNQVKFGNPVTISAIVSNSGSEAGTYSVVLRINGMVENIIDLMLSPGASQATTFTVNKDGGEYYAEVDGLSGVFVVIPLVQANFTVSNLTIAPERAKQGENIIISAMVTNNGELPGTFSTELKLKGAVESTEEINLGPGENGKISFKIAKTTPGFYNVELEGLTGRFVVEMEWQGSQQ